MCDRNLSTALTSFPDSRLKGIIINFCQIPEQINDLENQLQQGDAHTQRILRKLKFDYKKARSALTAELYRIARKAVKCYIETFKNEYEGLLNEIIAESLNLICTELELKPEKTLEENISIWIDQTRRFRYRWLDIVNNNQHRRIEDRLFDVLQEIVAKQEQGFTLQEFVNQTKVKETRLQSQGTEAQAQEFLQKQVNECNGTIITGKNGEIIYQFEPERVRLTPQQEHGKQTRIQPISIDTPIGENEEETLVDVVLTTGGDCGQTLNEIEKQELENQSTLRQKILEYIKEDPQKKLMRSHPTNKLECNCKYLIEQVKKNGHNKQTFAQIARDFNINYQTLKSHYNRKCLPMIYLKTLELYSHKITKKHQTEYEDKDEIFLRHINEDPDKKLSSCRLENINAQILAKRLLPIFGEKTSMTKLQEEYNISRDRLDRFWQLNVLSLLSKIVIELDEDLAFLKLIK